jgi:hypothetical protein
MNHQSDMTGMHVDNPLELQLLFSEKLFLDEKESVISLNHEAVDNEPELNKQISLPIAFFLDVNETQRSGIEDIAALLGRMLMVTLLDDKVPTIEMAEIVDLKPISQNDFNVKVKKHRKIILFSDNWPFDVGKEAVLFSVLPINEKGVFWVPSVGLIMSKPEIKKDFAAGLKQYFSIA